MRLLILLLVCVSLFLSSCKQTQQEHQQVTAAVPPTEEALFTAFLDSLQNAGATDYQKMNAIRKYVSSRVDYGSTRDSLSDNYYKIPWNEFSGFRCIRLFKENRLTAKCGLTSYVLSDLYNTAGFKNYNYDCGYQGTEATHEFNLVKLDDKLIMQDAFMNATLVDSSGAPKDFLQALREIKAKDFSNIKVVSDAIVSELWVDSLSKEFLSQFCASDVYMQYVKGMAMRDDRLKLSLTRSYDFLAGYSLEKARDKFKADGLSENFFSLYLKTVNVRDAETGMDDDSLQAVIASITGNGSPN